jgi:hypothetical protein
MTHESVRVLRSFLAALAAMLAAFALFACLRPTRSINCPRGLVCEADQRCPPDDPNVPNKCLAGPNCGNFAVEGSEECDDGDDDDDDNCIDCRNSFCGDGYIDGADPRREECDPGAPGTDSSTCNRDCTLARCGDGYVNPKHVPDGGSAMGEECDPGSADGGADTDDGGNTPFCNSNCTAPSCGDRITNTAAGEECDDGQETSTCNFDCTKTMCGDDITNRTAGEQCEPPRTGGMPVDDVFCDSDCTFPMCGDGHRNQVPGVDEVCDDGNTDACGTCSPDCKTPQMMSTKATGRIDVTSIPNDGAMLTINDGINSLLVLEFDTNGSCTSTSDRACINISSGSGAPSNDDVAGMIATTINGFGLRLLVTPTQNGSRVEVAHDLEGQIGNGTDPYAIVTRSPSTMGIALSNLSDGMGYNCPAGTNPPTGCVRNADCRARNCSIPPGKERGTCEVCSPTTNCQSGYCYRRLEPGFGICLPFECQKNEDCQPQPRTCNTDTGTCQ